MKIYFDKSTHCIRLLESEHDMEFGQFRTPLTQYAAKGLPWVLDNGVFSRFEHDKFVRMQADAIDSEFCEWIVVPDVVGNSDRTLKRFLSWTDDYPLVLEKAAYVAQDGQSSALVPWEDIVCLFIGGTDAFKDSQAALLLAMEAKRRGKWVHVGRLNSTERLVSWYGVADSCDGSGISRFTHQRDKLIKNLKDLERTIQTSLKEWC